MSEDVKTISPRAPFGRGLMLGVAAGAAAGAGWWLVEAVANWAFRGVIPISVHAALLGLDVAIGAAGGLVLGAVLALTGRLTAGALAMGMAVVYGLIRIYEPPGILGEAMFIVLGVMAVNMGRSLTRAQRDDVVTFVRLMLITTAFIALGKAIIGEAQSDYFSKTEPSGASLALLLAALPVAAVVVDRIVGLVFRRGDVRLAAELVAAAVFAIVWHQGSLPLASPPLQRAAASAATADKGAPDVILISMDTTRADHMSVYGYERETSPRLTEFAKDALNFVEARSPAQWTVPGHASMFTGMYPSRHGAHYAGDWNSAPVINGRQRVLPLADDRTTVAETLEARGYVTAGFVANFANLDRNFGMAQGFQHYEDNPGLLFRPVPHVVRLFQRFRPADFKKPFRSADDLNEAALGWLDDAAKDKPAFVFLNYLEPHHWLAAPPYDIWARDLPNAKRRALKGLFTHAIPAGLSDEEREFVEANYDGQVLAMDAAVGRLFDALKERGRYENTLIIVTSDHGELLGEHDIVGHGGRMMYEGLLHIPMIVKFPGADRPRGESRTPVQLVDVLPTVVTTTGAKMPGGVQGESLRNVDHPVLAEEHINPEFVSQFGAVYNRALRAMYDGTYKLITTSRGQRFLFDLANDRAEERNLASKEPERVAKMEEALEAAMSGMDPKVASIDPATSPGVRAGNAIGEHYR